MYVCKLENAYGIIIVIAISRKYQFNSSLAITNESQVFTETAFNLSTNFVSIFSVKHLIFPTFPGKKYVHLEIYSISHK